MARYVIRHSCGHVEEAWLYGSNAGGARDSRADALASQPCRACMRDAEEARLGIATALVGTAGQVAWARDVRLRMVRRLLSYAGPASAHMSGRCRAVADARTRALVSWVSSHEDASWYLSNRAATPSDLARMCMAERAGRRTGPGSDADGPVSSG